MLFRSGRVGSSVRVDVKTGERTMPGLPPYLDAVLPCSARGQLCADVYVFASAHRPTPHPDDAGLEGVESITLTGWLRRTDIVEHPDRFPVRQAGWQHPVSQIVVKRPAIFPSHRHDLRRMADLHAALVQGVPLPALPPARASAPSPTARPSSRPPRGPAPPSGVAASTDGSPGTRAEPDLPSLF